VDSFNSVYSSMDGVLFNKSQTKLIQYPGGKAGAYTIPDGVTTIDKSGFEGCTNLTNVTIPSSVTEVRNYAFAFCPSLAGVYFKGNAPSVVGGGVFQGANPHTIVY
jgi:hypothetical protein